MTVNKGKKLYEGKAKIIYEGPEKVLVYNTLKMMLRHLIIKKNLLLKEKEF